MEFNITIEGAKEASDRLKTFSQKIDKHSYSTRIIEAAIGKIG